MGAGADAVAEADLDPDPDPKQRGDDAGNDSVSSQGTRFDTAERQTWRQQNERGSTISPPAGNASIGLVVIHRLWHLTCMLCCRLPNLLIIVQESRYLSATFFIL